ncbi:MAG TPA: hypothetical protein H9796_04975 [Candidatus Butyricimonas faecavium]|nr:hypothetical protein [Candidatus Butyricimonas faecavium]
MTPDYMRDMADSYITDGVTMFGCEKGCSYRETLRGGNIVGPSVYTSSFWVGLKYYGGGTCRIHRDTRR